MNDFSRENLKTLWFEDLKSETSVFGIKLTKNWIDIVDVSSSVAISGIHSELG